MEKATILMPPSTGLSGISAYIKFDTIVYEGLQVINLKKKIIFLFLMIDFVLANSADPDEMPPYAAFHLGLHCLP